MGVLRDLLRDGRFKVGFIIVCFILFLGILSFFSPYDPTIWNVAPRDLPPSLNHILGTNSQGQDVFWQMTFAIRNSLTIAVIAAFFSRIIAILVGLIAGYRGGRLDRFLMALNDSFLVLPLLPILILISSLIKGRLSFVMLGLILSFFGWSWDARVIRSQILSLRERDFTYTAILSGSNTINLVFKEYFPFVIPIVFSTLINNMSWAIGMEITLAILGLTNLEIPTLGTMLQWAISYQAMMLGLWWWLLTPVVVSVVLFVSLYLLSVSISEYLDPRTRIQRIRVVKE
ncbi:MAG TPA: ABC transporter permease [Dictyoglomaceae bacterium]|nr:ABC transporter permease [Dictyoglomaceae bacterium]HOL39324.1 ABC transporter permease [Dictyoglomaceae bacterium]HOP95023.1 ABC transporter permease [Dictyoglomaceae bacterium]HPP15994.1 ABC transporter permease [Dictyoglomaceae bacterium]HPU42985.1 ABC transporter permease [Dictyoglomaceae bacterium]